MKHLGTIMRVAVVLAVGLVYCGVVWLGLTEEGRRSLVFTKESAAKNDYVVINVRVTAIDPVQRLVHERVRIIPMGRFAIDKATPAVDLRLLINSVSGEQSILYPKGERIGPIDFSSPLIGNLNRYPFDRYTADIDLVVTAAAAPPPPPSLPPPASRRGTRAPRAAPADAAPAMPSVPAKPSAPTSPSAVVSPSPPANPSVPASPASKLSTPDGAAATEKALEGVDGDAMLTTLVVGPSDLHRSEAVPIQENFVATIAGVKFDGEALEDDAFKLVRTSLVMRRANNVITISIVVMTVMFILAVSVMVMALRVTSAPSEINLIPLSLCVALIFGLPALRATQPDVPGVGALCDYLSFIWAELLVSSSAIGLAWTWIVRSIELQRRAKQAPRA